MWFDHSRKTYNLALAAVQEGKFKPLDEDRMKWRFVTEQQLGRKLSYLSSTPSKIRAGAIADLCAAFKGNFTKRKKDPNHTFNMNFRSRKRDQSLSLQKDSFIKPNSKVKCRLFFPASIKDEIKTSPSFPESFWTSIPADSRMTMNPLGEIYLRVPMVNNPVVSPALSSDNVISLDPGVRSFLTGFAPNSNTPFVEIGGKDIGRVMRLAHHLDRMISKHARCTSRKDSRTLARRIERLRLRIQRLKTDCHHRVADYLTKTYATIVIPEFDTSKMIRKAARKINKKSVRQMLTWGHYAFRQKLIAKATERGKRVILVTEEYTSKTCCMCGTIKYNLGGNKTYRCLSEDCKLRIDRDWNGAVNILVKYLTEKFTTER